MLKVNKIWIVSIFLLAILTFGAVSASDGISDGLTVDDNGHSLSVPDDVDLSIGEGDDLDDDDNDDLDDDDDDLDDDDDDDLDDDDDDLDDDDDDDLDDDDLDDDDDDLDDDDDDDINVTEFTIEGTNLTNPLANKEYELSVFLPKDASGQLYIYTDEDKADDDFDPEEFMEWISADDGAYYTEFSFKYTGKRVLYVQFESDDQSICKSYTNNIKYAVNDYEIGINVETGGDDESFIRYGDSAYVEVSFPYGVYDGYGDIYVNGKLRATISFEDDNCYEFSVSNVNTPVLNITAKVRKASEFKDKTVTKLVNVMPNLKVDYNVPFDEKLVVELVGPVSDKEYVLSFDGDVIYSGVLEDGSFKYTFPELLEFGQDHTFYVNSSFGGYETEICVGPSYSLAKIIWSGDDNVCTIRFPDKFIKSNLTVRIDIDEYNFEIPQNGTVEVAIPKLSEDTYSIEVEIYDDEGDLIYSGGYGFEVRDDDPNFELNPNYMSEIAYGNGASITINPPESAKGSMTLLINGKEYENAVNNGEEIVFEIPAKILNKGSNKFSLTYTGDGYFSPKVFNGTIKASDYVVNIPSQIVINDDAMDKGYVYLNKDAKGELFVYAKGKEYCSFDVEMDYDTDDMDNKVFIINFNDLALGSQTIKVKYLNNKGKTVFERSFQVNVSYTILIYDESESEYFNFGENNHVSVRLPEDAKGKFTVKVNGGITNKWERDDNFVSVDVSDYCGNFTVTVTYNGDSKYTPLSVSETFMAKPSIIYSTDAVYKNTAETVALNLPKDAKGILQVNVNGESYADFSFVNGHAGVAFSDLDMGDYEIYAFYNGTDYEVAPVEFDLYVSGSVIMDGKFFGESNNMLNYGDTFSVYVYVPTNTVGTLMVDYGDYSTQKDLKNGYAKIDIEASELGVGERYIYAYLDYDESDYGFSVDEVDESVIVVPKINCTPNMVVFGDNKVSVNTYDSYIDGTLEVIVDEDKASSNSYSKNLKNGKATVSLSSLTAGKHTFTINYYDDGDELIYSQKVTRNVKKASAAKVTASNLAMYYQDGSSFKVKVVGVYGKPLKNAPVVIKINKKKVKTVKTNAKGYAVYKIGNLPKKYKISATYGKIAVSKKLTVKQPLTLKKVNVKRSAKKLVLTAVLKGKKAYKHKVLIFKFNGKKYKAKTNKKGVATVIVNKKVLNKLKVNKKVKYQVTYLKDTVKRTAKVKK